MDNLIDIQKLAEEAPKGRDMPKEIQKMLGGLTIEQRGIISKNFDYFLYLDYMHDDANQDKKEIIAKYRKSFLVHIIAMVEMFSERNNLVKLGILKD